MSFKVKWLYRLQEDFEYQSKYKFPCNYRFLDKEEITRMEIYKDGTIVVKENYCWDGCTPKFNFIDISFGVPDGITNPDTLKPKCYYASLVHDALCQFILSELPLSKRQVDGIFYDLLKRSEFKPRYIYWVFVRIFGYLFLLIDKMFRRNKGVRIEF